MVVFQLKNNAVVNVHMVVAADRFGDDGIRIWIHAKQEPVAMKYDSAQERDEAFNKLVDLMGRASAV